MSKWSGFEDLYDLIEKEGYESIADLTVYLGMPYLTPPITHHCAEDLAEYYCHAVMGVSRYDKGGVLVLDDESWFDYSRRSYAERGLSTVPVDEKERKFKEYVRELRLKSMTAELTGETADGRYVYVLRFAPTYGVE